MAHGLCFNPPRSLLTGDTIYASVWILPSMFQSAPVIADRGYPSCLTDCAPSSMFQSAPVIADRGYPCRFPSSSPLLVFQSAPVIADRGYPFVCNLAG